MIEDDLKQTPLTQMHLEAGAKMGAFAGFTMPLFYPLGLMKEHIHTREKAGLFDVSHMVHIEVSGPESARLISHLCPCQAAAQEIGSCRYTFFLNERAGIIDDLIVTRLGEERFLMVVNAGCAEKDVAHVNGQADKFDVSVKIIPRGFLALQGPKAEAALAKCGFDLSSCSFNSALETENGWFISRTGYTGEDGFEIGLPVEETAAFVTRLLENDDVRLIGLGARDSLRLEAGLSLYGQDLDEETTPHEAGLVWAIAKPLREGGDFIGSAAFAEKIIEGRKRKRVGLKPKQKIPVRAGAKLTDENDHEIGSVTSGGFGPTVDYPVALGLITIESDGGSVFADVRGRKIEMEIVKLPFTPHNYKR